MMEYLGILTRCRDEFYIKEWCDYYLSQGVDGIHIIDDDSEDKSIYEFTRSEGYENVHVVYSKRIYDEIKTKPFVEDDPRDLPNRVYEKIRANYKWLIYCDVDEFIVTKKHFSLTIREQLSKIEDENSSINLLFVPWVFMSGAKLAKNPKSVLQEILFRQDHDKKHVHPVKKFRCRYDEIEIKSIFQPRYFERILDHKPVGNYNMARDSINLTKRFSGSEFERIRFMKLRNEDVENGIFLCYHYRYISDENSLNKLSANGWYDGYNLNDLKSSSYPEIYDDTMLRKLVKDGS